MSTETTPWRYRSPESEALGIIAWQYKKKSKQVWDSCGEHTYDIYKNDEEYDVRRLVELQLTDKGTQL